VLSVCIGAAAGRQQQFPWLRALAAAAAAARVGGGLRIERQQPPTAPLGFTTEEQTRNSVFSHPAWLTRHQA